jgi:hypothetical protein
VLPTLLLGGIAWLIGFSLQLAATRIFQVDECMEVYVARILASVPDKTSAGHVTLFQVALSGFLSNSADTVALLEGARLVMLLLFWINWLLIACATGERVFSRRWLVALAGAATLAPIWDYGFEVRHDNLLLMGLLVMWCLLRVAPGGLRSYFLLGVIAVVLEFVAFKAFVYTLPISLLGLVFPHLARKVPRWKLAAVWAAGALSAFAVLRITFGVAGLWPLFLAGFGFLSTAASGGSTRYWPTLLFSQLLKESPLLLALVLSGLIAAALEWRKKGKLAWSWDGILPETVLLLIALVALLINPAPYPYNFLHLVPYAFLFAFKHAYRLWDDVGHADWFLPPLVGLIIFAHVIPFTVAVRRHLDWPNTRQEQLIKLTESVTDPIKDPVFDAVGLVPTRPIIDNRAFLHSLNFASFVHGPGPQIRDLLAARPAAVIIPNYRTDWLPQPDHDYIQEHYVAVADDFLVLGKVLPAGGGDFEIVHPGRYRLASLPSSGLEGTYKADMEGYLQRSLHPVPESPLAGTLDGQPIGNRPVPLTVGKHHLDCPPGCQPTVVWVGPQLDRLPLLGPADHGRLFVNWY